MRLHRTVCALATIILAACGGSQVEQPDIVDVLAEPDLPPEIVVEVVADVPLDLVEDITPDLVEVVDLVEVEAEVEVLPLPTAEILQPLDGKVLNVALESHFVGQVSDPLEPMENLTVVFKSDIDGQLFEGTPDEDGVVEFDYIGFTPGPQVITMTVTNKAWLSSSETINIHMNIPPVGPIVTVVPEQPGTSDTLHAIVTGEAYDPEGAEVEVLIDWFNEGVPVNSLDGLVDVPPELTKKGETWSCVVRAFDGYSYGFAEQDKVTIGNSPPAIESVLIDPDQGNKKTTFTCLGQGAVDPDDDEVKLTYAWLVNDEPFVDASGNTIDGALLAKGDELRCEVTPLDEWLAGEPVLSDAVTVGNTPPEGGSAVLSPAVGPVDAEFTCAPDGAVDPDGSNVGYKIAWLADGLPIDGAKELTYTPLALSKGDVLRCRATPTDGEDYGSPIDSNSVVLINSPPTASGVSVSPDAPTVLDDLTCTVDSTADLDDDPVTVDVVWKVNGDVVANQSGPSLPAGLAHKGDEVTCSVIPDDGDGAGAKVDADNTVTVNNTPPMIDSATISPASGDETTLFTCVVGGWYDPDPEDLFDVSYQWLVNDAPVDNGGSAQLWGVYFDAGDTIVCQATPEDEDTPGGTVASDSVTISQ